jgi:ComF family protein
MGEADDRPDGAPASGVGAGALPGRTLVPGPVLDRAPRPWWRRALAAAGDSLDVVFPPVCLNCHGLVEGGGGFRHLCAGCVLRLALVEPPHCTTCGFPFFGRMDENAGCAHCAALQPVFREGRTAALLQGPLRQLVHALKYENATYVLTDIRAIVRANAHLCQFLEGAVLVPVPLHARKHRERGYNQAGLIARCFAAEAPGAVVRPLLRRLVDTSTQTRLARAERAANLKNAFALAGDGPVEPAARYVLVDDVFTTGATLNACATVLRTAGLTCVDVATLGHG